MKSNQKHPTKRNLPYKKKPYTPSAKQTAVGALALAGKNKSQIAKNVGLSRETVARILSQFEMEMRRAECRSVILEAVPELSRLLVEIAKTKNLEAILAALRGAKVLSNTLEVETQAPKRERTYAFTKVAFFHKFGRMPTLEEAIEFDKTLDMEPLVKASEE